MYQRLEARYPESARTRRARADRAGTGVGLSPRPLADPLVLAGSSALWLGEASHGRREAMYLMYIGASAAPDSEILQTVPLVELSGARRRLLEGVLERKSVLGEIRKTRAVGPYPPLWSVGRGEGANAGRPMKAR